MHPRLQINPILELPWGRRIRNRLIRSSTSLLLGNARRATPGSCSAAAGSIPSTPSPVSATYAASPSLPRRRPHKCEVALDGLVEELGVVGLGDGFAGFGEGGVFDQCVALFKRNVSALDQLPPSSIPKLFAILPKRTLT